jgi:hypothetical protein
MISLKDSSFATSRHYSIQPALSSIYPEAEKSMRMKLRELGNSK